MKTEQIATTKPIENTANDVTDLKKNQFAALLEVPTLADISDFGTKKAERINKALNESVNVRIKLEDADSLKFNEKGLNGKSRTIGVQIDANQAKQDIKKLTGFDVDKVQEDLKTDGSAAAVFSTERLARHFKGLATKIMMANDDIERELRE